MNNDERIRLLSIYGMCRVCGEPRRHHTFEETDERGHTHIWTRLLCTADPTHGQEPADLAIIEGRG